MIKAVNEVVHRNLQPARALEMYKTLTAEMNTERK
jgi:hypothetical protein